MNKLKDRIFRCGESDFYHNEIINCNRMHTDKNFNKIADAGFNGIWLRGKLRELIPGNLFRDYVTNVEERLSALAKLCVRSERYGLGVWLYLTEPLGLEAAHPFWKKHPDLAGSRVKILSEKEKFSLCSSTKQVQDYLFEGFRNLFKQIPLRGVILITSSEQVNNCWAHVLSSPTTYPCPEKFWSKDCQCLPCHPRGPFEVISEILNLVNSGIKSANSKAKTVAWNWSWNMHCKPPYKPIIEKLDKSIILMGDFERGGIVQRANKRCVVEEYSLCYTGPSKSFQKEAEYSGKRSLFARLQINTTHELATVTNLPLVVSLYRKFAYLRKTNCSGIMAAWIIGCVPDTLNTFAVKKLTCQKVLPTEQDWICSLAQDYFGSNVNCEYISKALYGFSNACKFYPINGNIFVYRSPVNYALAYPLKLRFEGKEMGPSWIKHKFGDRLEDSLGDFDLATMVSLLKKLSSRWLEAFEWYKKTLSSVNNERGKKELAVAAITGCSFRSTYNIYRWYQSRRNKRIELLNAGESQIVEDEINNLDIALQYIEADKKFGFHEEDKWQIFTSSDIVKKLKMLKRRRVNK